MSVCRFRVTAVRTEPNLRGQKMRRVELKALPSEAFKADEELPDGVDPPDPDGSIRLLVAPSFAKRFALDDEFDLVFRERE